MKTPTHELAQKITLILIESGLSLSDQLKVLRDVKTKIEWCRNTAPLIDQYKLFNN